MYWRTKNGARPTPPYQAIFRNPEGQQISKSGFLTIEAAEAWLAEQRAARSRGVVVRPGSLTVYEWGEAWLRDHAKLTTGSRRLNEQRLRDHVYPVIGRKRLGGANGVSKHDVLAVRRSMEAPPQARTSSRRTKQELSQNTIKGVIAMLGAMFQEAVDEDLMALNPVRQLGAKQRRPKGREQREMVIVQPDQMGALIRAADDGPPYFGPLIYAALFTGMRQGELLGLRWCDVLIHGADAVRPRIVVRGQLDRRRDPETGRVEFSQRPLKSKGRDVYREIRINPQLAERLRLWRMQSSASTADQFVFVTADGVPPSDSTVRANFYRARGRAGLPAGLAFHHLRDTHASMLIRHGRPITEIAVRLGHTTGSGAPNPTTTLKHYAHLFDQEASADETCEQLERQALALEAV
ncbi:MAG TPA: site-specific integrase [Gaiellaceae bacterium]|nr:site-specific integrase [Gaiellaceae bacterium]